MIKENGRFRKAEKEELANLKGKSLLCPMCGKEVVVINATFGEMVCKSCGVKLVDKDMAQASKVTGRI